MTGSRLIRGSQHFTPFRKVDGNSPFSDKMTCNRLTLYLFTCFAVSLVWGQSDEFLVEDQCGGYVFNCIPHTFSQERHWISGSIQVGLGTYTHSRQPSLFGTCQPITHCAQRLKISVTTNR